MSGGRTKYEKSRAEKLFLLFYVVSYDESTLAHARQVLSLAMDQVDKYQVGTYYSHYIEA